MRRQTAGTLEVPQGEGRRLRLDPFELPARVSYAGAARAGTAPQIAIIGRDSVMIRRETAAGVPLYVTVPLAAYSGVLLSVREAPCGARAAIRLHHANGDLGVPLFEADDTDDVLADWRAWGRTLARPLLIEKADGEICEPHRRIGGVIVRAPAPRRANRFFAERRPRILCARRVGGALPGIVHRGREIIARDVAD